MSRSILLLSFLALTACASEPPLRYEVSVEQPTEQVRIAYADVSVREVSLPTYAAAEEIARAGVHGSVLSSADSLWADDPVRAVTLDFARTLHQITRARVAPDPWPFANQPDVAIDIRFEELLPDTKGEFRASGLYFVAPSDESGRPHAHAFNIVATFDPEGGYAALSLARGKIVNDLALEIAKSALR